MIHDYSHSAVTLADVMPYPLIATKTSMAKGVNEGENYASIKLRFDRIALESV
jgi:hypothetical protein